VLRINPGQFIDVGAVQIDTVQAAPHFLLQFRQRADALGIAVLRYPDRDRRSPVALATHRPVDVVFQPVAEPSFANVLWHPVDQPVVRHQTILHCGGADVPRAFGVVEEWRIAAPAEGVRVLDAPALQQQAARLQVARDIRVCLFEELACEAERRKLRQHIA
jgi:hypothetical protein